MNKIVSIRNSAHNTMSDSQGFTDPCACWDGISDNRNVYHMVIYSDDSVESYKWHYVTERWFLEKRYV